MGRLHAVPASSARAVGVTDDDQDVRQRLERLRRQANVAREALPGEPTDQYQPYLSGEIDVPASYCGPPVLLHNDLVAEHLVVNAETRGLEGVIDFTDAALGDPAQDFVGLLVAFEKRFVDRVLDAYAQNVDAAFWERLEFRADLLRLTQAAEAVRRGADTQTHRQGILNVSDRHDRSRIRALVGTGTTDELGTTERSMSSDDELMKKYERERAPHDLQVTGEGMANRSGQW